MLYIAACALVIGAFLLSARSWDKASPEDRRRRLEILDRECRR